MYDLTNKFIFTHPPKCGGTSIEELLGFLRLRNEYPHIHSFKHGSLEMHFDKIKSKNLEPRNFFKFSIIRNPWSRAVSFYNHLRYKEYDHFSKNPSPLGMPAYILDSRIMTFKDYCFKYYKNNFNSEVSTKPYMLSKGKFSLDYVIKLESLKEDFFSIKEKIGVTSDLEIPHLNNSDQYINRKHYKQYYDKETQEFIGNLFKWDIKFFNYKFEKE